MKNIRTLIIDDERLARAEMKLILAAYPEISIIGEAENADKAEKLIKSLQPDLIFLDIQMPGKSGFALLESLIEIPPVIFTTAFDQYAVKAFELSALDYLMKPIRQERLEKAIEKVRLNLFQNNQALNRSKSIFIKEGDKYHLIKTQDIFYIESIGNYARLHFDHQKVFFKCSLQTLQKSLDDTKFFRVNRSAIINTDFITQVQHQSNGSLVVVLKNGESYSVSIRQTPLFKAKYVIT